MKVQLHEQAGGLYSFNITNETTISDLKKRIEEQTGIPQNLIQIRHQGKTLFTHNHNEINLLQQLNTLENNNNLLIPPKRKEFSKEIIENYHSQKYVDLDILYDIGGGCLTVYRWRCYWCFIVEFDMANGCTECGICGDKIASKCKDDGCAVNCCCEKCSCECCVGKCSIM